MTMAAESRRSSACSRHPSSVPVTGICPSCLHDRLSSPDLRRSKSHSTTTLPYTTNLRRKSCDSRPRTSLSHLFQSDSQNRHTQTNYSDQDTEENTKPIKELIESELQNINNRPSLWASVFAQKLHKWRLKQQHRNKPKKTIKTKSVINTELFKTENVVGRRRSCDTEPRFSMDENTNGLSLEEPRASWDGYMIARTIPRLAPMLSVIESAMKEEEMVVEDETNSISESSSSARRNSFDCSSSGKSSSKNRMHVEIDDLKAKVMDTGVDTAHLEMDLYEDPSKRFVSAAKNPDSLKKKMLKILGFKSKSTETRYIGDKQIGGGNGVANEVFSGKVLGRNSYSYHRSPNIAEIRGHVSTFDRTRSVRCSPSPINFENGLLRFHLTPQLPLSRKKKPERRSVLNLQTSARGVS